ncbi:MAG: ATP-dependent dethiobiotin synthetase BioD, partial [Thermoplasmatota archaeon]
MLGLYWLVHRPQSAATERLGSPGPRNGKLGDADRHSPGPNTTPRLPSAPAETVPLDVRITVAGGLFVTGTDTGVGKTVVTAALAGALRASGLDVGVMKPVQTGALETPEGLVAPDAALLARAAGVDDPPELVCPVLLRAPLAPSVAA